MSHVGTFVMIKLFEDFFFTVSMQILTLQILLVRTINCETYNLYFSDFDFKQSQTLACFSLFPHQRFSLFQYIGFHQVDCKDS